MKILLSPAKSIDTKRNINTPHFNTCKFIEEAQHLMNLQRQLSPEKLAKTLKISDKLATQLYLRNNKWEYPNRLSENVKPCITIFSGEVYRGLNVETWTQDDFLYADNNLRVLSGMYGILKPLDLIYPYRLEMGTKWQISENVKNIYAYWKTRIVESLLQELEDRETIINLASAEYYKVVDFEPLRSRTISIQFLDFSQNKYKTIAVYAKNARGKMARFAVQKKISDPNQLKLYNEDGYCFQKNVSSENTWIFTR